MDKLNERVTLPRFLWNFHGKQTYLSDLLLTYGLSVSFAMFTLLFSGPLPWWKTCIVLVLSIDIGGGVISNLTAATMDFYRRSSLSPHAFIWFHLLQAAALTVVYWNLKWEISFIALLTMFFASSVILSKHAKLQISVFLFALLTMVVIVTTVLPKTVALLLIFLGFKLIIGFAAHWYSCI